MVANLPDLDVVRTELERVLGVAEAGARRTILHRASPDAALHAVILGLLGVAVVQGHCVVSALKSPMPQGRAPNVRALLESLVTVAYLTDEKATTEQAKDRLSRYYRWVRREQVRLRSGLDAYPKVRTTFITDEATAERERLELEAVEAELPKAQRLGKHWSGLPGLEAVAKEVSLGSDYAVQYRLSSGTAHGTRPWDVAILDQGGLLVLPDLDRSRSLGIPQGFDAMRYVAWILRLAQRSGAVELDESEQQLLAEYDKYLQSLDSLLKAGVVGAGIVAPPAG